MTPEQYEQLRRIPEDMLSDEQASDKQEYEWNLEPAEPPPHIKLADAPVEVTEDDMWDYDTVGTAIEPMAIGVSLDGWQDPEWVEPSPAEGLRCFAPSDITTRGIAGDIGNQLVGKFGAIVDRGKLYVWDKVSQFRQLSDRWLWEATDLFHGMGPDADSNEKVFNAHGMAKKDVAAQTLMVVQRECKVPMENFFAEAPALLAFFNGTYVWQGNTLQWVTNDPAHRARFSMHFAHQQTAELPEHIHEYLHSHLFGGVPEEERNTRVAVLCTHAGLAMLGAQHLTGEARHPVLVGERGCGKSTWATLVERCCAPGSVSHGQWSEQSKGGFDGGNARLCYEWSKLNIVDDASSAPIRDTGTLKTITSFGVVQVRTHGRAAEIRVKASQLVLSNSILKMQDDGGGMQRRMLYIECPNTVAGNGDPRLVDKLLASGKEQFVSYCITLAADMLTDSTHFPTPSCHMAMMTRQVLSEGDKARTWLADWFTSTYKETGSPSHEWPSATSIYDHYKRDHELDVGDARLSLNTRLPYNAFGRALRSVPWLRSRIRGSARVTVYNVTAITVSR